MNQTTKGIIIGIVIGILVFGIVYGGGMLMSTREERIREETAQQVFYQLISNIQQTGEIPIMINETNVEWVGVETICRELIQNG